MQVKNVGTAEMIVALKCNYLKLTYDERLVNGRVGFLGEVTRILQQPVDQRTRN